MATDSRATQGDWIASQTVKKVIEINSCLLGTMAGGAAVSFDHPASSEIFITDHWFKGLSILVRLLGHAMSITRTST